MHILASSRYEFKILFQEVRFAGLNRAGGTVPVFWGCLRINIQPPPLSLPAAFDGLFQTQFPGREIDCAGEEGGRQPVELRK